MQAILPLQGRPTCCTMVKEPEMSAWLAMTAADVASTTETQRRGSGMDSQ